MSCRDGCPRCENEDLRERVTSALELLQDWFDCEYDASPEGLASDIQEILNGSMRGEDKT